jgi:uncharacterized protein (TIGR02246 family)
MTSTDKSPEALHVKLDALLEGMQRLADIEEITQLKAKYFRAVDTKDWKLFAEEVLTEDAHFDMEGTLVDGRDEIVAFVSKTIRYATTVHHGHTREITITGPSNATGLWAMYDYVRWHKRDGSEKVIHGYGHYDEEYVRTPAGWRLRSSRLTRLRVDTAIIEPDQRDEGDAPR